ncbi:hypothetical protein LOC68_05590 [Blastopirellula sp. JC732]|uniref:HEAT repeat domain-containing protein n=1 Tax=Blastopirellula sediminis TaxID=2894196 RepID=A0A9X1MKC5_9BACT|nr:hypothetical protein [Blastopirellula sediminis]MCC9609363.1 hypothetical protein [Blastopirellula sediminis]MCC9627860.1 hypothetical protein [Blastopirellula sediminis]
MYQLLFSPRGLASLLIVAIAIVGAAPYICASYLQSYADAQLAQAPDDDIEFYLRRQLEISSHPEEDLIDALSSERAPLALAATNVLKQKRGRWRDQAAIRYRDEAIEIAVQLSARWEQLSPTARQAAVHLAEDVATWNLGLEPEESRQFNEAIDQILRRSAAASPADDSRPLLSALTMLPPPQQSARPHEYETPEQIAAAPGGYLSVVPEHPDAKVARQLHAPSGFPSAAALTSKPIDPQGNNREPFGSTGSMGIAPGVLPESARPSFPTDLTKLADVDVMHWLHDSRPEVIELAEKELLRRRFQPFELDMARKLTSPSVQDRLRLAKELSIETDFDRKMWLVELAHDVDADVRIVAQKQLMQLRITDRGAPAETPR